MPRLSWALYSFATAQAAAASLFASGLLDPDLGLLAVFAVVGALTGSVFWVASELDQVVPEESYPGQAMILCAPYLVAAFSYLLVELELAELPILLIVPAVVLIPIAHFVFAWRMARGRGVRTARSAALGMGASVAVGLLVAALAGALEVEAVAGVAFLFLLPVPLLLSALSAAVVGRRVAAVSQS